MVTWPSTLKPLKGSVQETPPENAIRSDMDVGPAKVRRRTTANIRPLTFSMRLTGAQTATLDTFYNTDTFSGVEPFDFKHPRTGSTVTARFVSPPSYQDVDGVMWDVNIDLEILP